MTLSPNNRTTIIDALRLAADRYDITSAQCSRVGQHSMADLFSQRASQARELATQIREAK